MSTERRSVDRPVASVVIATRNRVHLLPEAVESVVMQTFREWELIVVDDASEDGTPAWLTSSAAQRVTPILLEMQVERSRARNYGLAQARGDFVLFLDDDDRLLPTALERLVGGLDDPRRAACAQAIGGRIETDAAGRVRRVSHARRLRIGPVWPEMLGGWWWPGTGQCLFRRAAIEAIGGYDPELASSEDQEIQFRLSRIGPAVLVAGVVLEVRNHPLQRRDPSAAEIADRLHVGFAASLAGRDALRAARLRRSHSAVLIGLRATSERRFGAALAYFLRATRIAPEIVRSPLSRTLVVRAVVASAVKALVPRLR
jgi:glycosyltransferase involved in cell wall biosynthesis